MRLQADRLLSPKHSAVCVAALAGWSYGYSTSIISGLSNTLVINTYCADITDPQTLSLLQGLLTACIMIGGIVGSFIGPIIANKYGRRAALTACGVITVLSCTALGSVSTYASTVALRSIVGIGMGFTGTVAPLYMAEVSSIELRGSLGVLFEVGLCNGMLIAMFINYVMSPGLSGDINAVLGRWSIGVQFGLGAVPGLLLCVLPYWLRETNIKRHSISANAPSALYSNHIDTSMHTLHNSTPASAIQVMNSPMASALGQMHASDAQLNHKSIGIKTSDMYDDTDNSVDTLDKLDSQADSPMDKNATSLQLSDRGVSESVAPVTTIESHKLIKRNAPVRSSLSVVEDSVNSNLVTSIAEADDTPSPWAVLFTTRKGLYYVGLGVLLTATDMFTGINAVFFYSPTIFTAAGLNNVLLYTFATVGVWNLVTCIFPYYAVDRFGRRPLFLTSLYGMSASMLLLALDFLVFPASVAPAFSIALVLCFLACWQLGVGALFFLLAAELYPDEIRAEALIFTNVLGWIFNILMSFIFPILTALIGTGYTLLLHVGVCFLCSTLAYLFLPETKSMVFSSAQMIHG